MSTFAPTELNFFLAKSTIPALRGAAPDVINLRDRKLYLLVAAAGSEHKWNAKA
jgi:hypothetical protein